MLQRAAQATLHSTEYTHGEANTPAFWHLGNRKRNRLWDRRAHIHPTQETSHRNAGAFALAKLKLIFLVCVRRGDALEPRVSCILYIPEWHKMGHIGARLCVSVCILQE